MSDTTKPPGEPPQLRRATAGAPPILSAAESSILAAYRAMDDETRDCAVGIMLALSKDFPRAPRLQLVVGGRS